MGRMASLKRVFLVVAVVAAFSAVPAFAVSPTLTDDGSAFWTVYVKGSNFTPSSWAYVEAIDNDTGIRSADGWFQTSDMQCFIFGLRAFFCTGGGDFSAYLAPNTQCGSGRTVWAYDWGSGQWSNPIVTTCA